MKQKIVNGVRVYHRYSVSHIITLILLLSVIAVPVIFLFLPLVKSSSGDYILGVKEMVLSLFGLQDKGILEPAHYTEMEWFIATLIKPCFPESNQFLNGLGTAVIYTMKAIPLITLIPALIALIYFIIGCFGRWKRTKGPRNLLWWQFVLTLLSVIIPVCFVLTNNTYRSQLNCLICYIVVGALFVIAIVVTVIYNCAFKNRMYYKDAKKLPSAYPGSGMIYSIPNGQNVATQPVQQVVAGQPQVIYVKEQPAKANNTQVVPTPKVDNVSKGLPAKLSSIGGHAFSQNQNLEVALIPSGIVEIGPSAFSNCQNLKVVSIPRTVTSIGYNAFFGCKNLVRINYSGKKSEWTYVKRGSNWLTKAGTTTVVCIDGSITVNPYH